MIRPLICLILCLGCDSAAHDTRIDDAFVQCVAMQFQFVQVKESAPKFEIPAIELKSETPAAQGEREDATTAQKAKELTPAAAKPAVPVRTTAPLILFGYEGCAACKFIHEGLRAKGIPHSYRLVQPKPGVEYPFATSDGKHMNYNRLKELIR